MEHDSWMHDGRKMGLPATGTSHGSAPCRQLANLGSTACQQQWGIQPFDERHRDSFARRTGRLPEQREEDSVDYRGLLHRDGTVLSLVTLEVRKCAPEEAPCSFEHGCRYDNGCEGECQIAADCLGSVFHHKDPCNTGAAVVRLQPCCCP